MAKRKATVQEKIKALNQTHDMLSRGVFDETKHEFVEGRTTPDRCGVCGQRRSAKRHEEMA